MIERKDLLALNFYKTSPFTGSDDGMRYRVEKIITLEPTEDEGAAETAKQADASTTEASTDAQPKNVEVMRLQATVWPEPFSYDHTPDDKKVRHVADFSEEGLIALTAWMNEMKSSF